MSHIHIIFYSSFFLFFLSLSSVVLPPSSYFSLSLSLSLSLTIEIITSIETIFERDSNPSFSTSVVFHPWLKAKWLAKREPTLSSY